MNPTATETLRLPMTDGTPLHLQRFTPAHRLAHGGLIVLTHGFGEHSGRYGHVVEALLGIGLHVIRYDLRGHGRSEGRRGDARSFDQFVDDLATVIDYAQTGPITPLPRPQPLFLFGHSMGGLVTLRFLQKGLRPVDGAIAASPWIRLAFDPPAWKLLIARIARSLCPSLRLGTGMNPSRLSLDAEFLASMPDLHLSHHFLSARLFHSVLETCLATRADAAKVETPLLLLHGQHDPVTSWQATSEFYREVGAADKTLILYPTTRHEAHNDLDRAKVLGDLTAWLAARLSPPLGETPASPEPPPTPSPPLPE